ncbi:MAG: hypothetical protein MJY69_08130 [Bacteroidales bacterium]|nr:hypothetical protein [Bacteroidales bacterium]
MTPEELFDSFTPDLGDKDRYIKELSKKLESMETLHRICEENARKTRVTVLAATFVGVLFGGIIMAIVLLAPTSGVDFCLKLGLRVLNFSVSYSSLALLLLSAVPVCLFIALSLCDREQAWK